MEFKTYQDLTAFTQKEEAKSINYLALGIAGEAGEIANKVKKIERDFGGEITPEIEQEISREIGDVLWYAARLSAKLNKSLDDIAFENLKKLFNRKEQNKISGSGDNR